MTINKDILKKKAAEATITFLSDNIIIGLGTGSTVYFALELISEYLKSGKLKNIKGIPSSKSTKEIAIKFGIPLTNLSENPIVDINIDGADEVDASMNLIKGGGGALLREKIIAQASKKNIIMVDESKLSKNLGEKFYLPLEVLPFAVGSELHFLKERGLNPKLRMIDDKLIFTDQGNNIIDLFCGKIDNPEELSSLLHLRAGILEHGLFINLTNVLVIGKENGVEILTN